MSEPRRLRTVGAYARELLPRFKKVRKRLRFVRDFVLFPLSLRRLSRVLGIRGEAVLVVGSAPSASLEGLEPFSKVIGIHASPELVRVRFNLQCDVVVVDQSLFNSNFTEKDSTKKQITKNGLLKKNPQQTLVVSASNTISPTVPFESIVPNRRSFFINRDTRRLLLRHLSLSPLLDSPDGSSMVGTGALAIAIAFVGGARSVQFTGINLSSGLSPKRGGDEPVHFYEQIGLEQAHEPGSEAAAGEDSLPRNHSAADSLLIASLALRFGTLSSNEKELKPLLNNWSLSSS